MFSALIAAIIVAASAATLYRVSSSQKQLPPPEPDDQPDIGPRTVEQLRINDVIEIDLIDFVVVGLFEFEEDGHSWKTAQISDGTNEQFLTIGISRAGKPKFRLTRPVKIDVAPYPPTTLLVENNPVELSKKGTATVRMRGNAARGGNTSGRCRYWLYGNIEGDTIIAEQWGEDFIVYSGKIVDGTSIEFMQAS